MWPVDTFRREDEVAFGAVKLDARRVVTLADDRSQASRYRISHGHVWLGTNAFFFGEGMAKRFEDATYGEFRVDRESGEAG